jgi:integrase
MARKASRRDRGDGGLHLKHAATCPPMVDVVGEDGKTRKVRPEHRGCKGLWVARVDLGIGGDGKRRSREVASRDYAVAVQKLRELRRQVEDGQTALTSSMTLTKWVDQWLSQTVAMEKDPKTLAGYRSACETWIKPNLGAHRLDRLEPQHVRELHKKMRDAGRAESSVLKVHNVLAKCLKDAMGEMQLARNVTEHIKRPTPAKRNETLTTEQAKRLLVQVQTDPNGGRRAASLYLGIRQGEVLGMQWDRIDLETGTLDLAWQLQRLGYRHGCDGTCHVKRAGSCPQRELDVPPGFEHRQLDGGLCLTRPKGGRERMLPLPAPLLGWLVGRAVHQQGAPNPHGLVFTREDGRPIDPRTDLQEWHDALDAAKLPSVMLHAARHTTATLLREARVPVDVIQSILGHSSVVTTQGYIHEDLTLAREALSRLQIED